MIISFRAGHSCHAGRLSKRATVAYSDPMARIAELPATVRHGVPPGAQLEVVYGCRHIPYQAGGQAALTIGGLPRANTHLTQKCAQVCKISKICARLFKFAHFFDLHTFGSD
jgi:hypothetical protein